MTTVAWVRACLGLPVDHTGGSVERIGEGIGLSSTLLRVRTGDEPDAGSVVVKRWPLDDRDGDREVRVLQTFGDRLGDLAARCLHAEVDTDAGQVVMILEDVGDPASGEVVQGDHLQPVDGEVATRLGAAVGTLHGRWWASPELDAASTWLPRSPWLALPRDWFASRRERFLTRFPGRLDDDAARLLDNLEAAYAEAVDALAAVPDTLLHGDLHLDNVLFRATGDPVLLDWQRVCRGPASLDLVDLLAGMVVPDAREATLVAYLDALSREGVRRLDQVGASLAAASVVTFTKWTCGIATWEPAEPRSLQALDALIDRAAVAVGSRWD
jgi:aminoglycoside phosphotransferase (APT) family kinase protein